MRAIWLLALRFRAFVLDDGIAMKNASPSKKNQTAVHAPCHPPDGGDRRNTALIEDFDLRTR
jgi:hypothetical protein